MPISANVKFPSGARVMVGSAPTDRASPWQFCWLCFTILSFCYELPLAFVSGYDRVNPRLFDVAAVIGFFTVLPTIRIPARLPPVFRKWMYLVFWFVFCAGLWAAVWFPWEEGGKYSLFFAGKYLEGLLIAFLAACIPLDARQKRILHYLVVTGGVVVAVYAIPEYFLGGWERKLTDEKVRYVREGMILSCLGPNYFHVAEFCPMACAMTLALIGHTRNPMWSWPLFFLAMFVSWPAAACGSRAGLIGAGLVYAVAFIFIKRLRFRYVVLVATVFLAILGGIIRLPSIEELTRLSLSVARLVGLEEHGGGGSLAGRTLIGKDTYLGTNIWQLYSWQGWRLPMFGGGFYAVPHLRDEELVYRQGYGIHNIYLFSLEQGGIPALILFGVFLVVCYKELIKASRLPRPEDRAFALGAGVFLLALLIIGWAGQVFWRGFGTENFNSYIILLLVLATKETTPRGF